MKTVENQPQLYALLAFFWQYKSSTYHPKLTDVPASGDVQVTTLVTLEAPIH